MSENEFSKNHVATKEELLKLIFDRGIDEFVDGINFEKKEKLNQNTNK